MKWPRRRTLALGGIALAVTGLAAMFLGNMLLNAGPLSREQAISNARSHAAKVGLKGVPSAIDARQMSLADYMATTGAISMDPADSTHQVWVVVLKGDAFNPKGVPGGPSTAVDNVEVVYDMETGKFLASGFRRAGVEGPFR